MYAPDEVSYHLLRYFEIGDDAVLHRTYCDYIGRRSAKHLLGFAAYSLHFSAVSVQRYYRRLPKHYPFVLYVYQTVGRTKVHSHIVGKQSA